MCKSELRLYKGRVSANPVGPASCVFYRGWYSVHSRTKALRGAGAGACWLPPHVHSGLQDWWFYRSKMKDLAVGTVSGPDGSPIGVRGSVRRSSGELLGVPGSPKVV